MFKAIEIIELVAILIILIFVSTSTYKAGTMNGRLNMCKDLNMTFTTDDTCIQNDEYLNQLELRYNNIPEFKFNIPIK